jgi:hypothetical protein
MQPIGLRNVQKNVMILSFALILIALFALACLKILTPVSVVFLVLGFGFMTAHWLLLVSFTRAFTTKDGLIVNFQGMLSVLPASLALALVFIAGRSNASFLLPAVIGLIAVPIAATMYGLFCGLHGCLQFLRRKGLTND